MSRCFPFPPPGYERKPIIEDTNALKEEKKKEKKHKKEKKDKEKREGKEKTDKERSDGKHREKKDKKEKHKKEKDRDKKKDKEKDKGKDEENGSKAETSAVPSNPGTQIKDKLGTKEEKDTTSITNEKINGSFFHRQNGEKPFSSSLPFGEMEDSKFVLELARRINDEEKVTTNQLDRFSGAEKKKADEGEKTPYKSSGDLLQVKRKESKDKDKYIEEEKMGGKGNRDEVRFSETSMVLAGTGKRKIADLPRAVEEKEKRVEEEEKRVEGKEKRMEEKERRVEKKEKRMEEKEKAKEKDDKTKSKHKSKEGEKKSHRKDKDKEKEKKKAEKAKGKKDEKNTEPDKSENVNQIDFPGRKNEPDNSRKGSRSYPVGSTEMMGSVPLSDHRNHDIVEGNEKKRKELDINGFLYPVGFTEVTGSIPLSDHGNHAMVEGNEKKRKEIDRNGFLYDNEVRPNKIPRQLLENGRKPESNQSPILLTPEKHSHTQGPALHLKVDNKKQRKNGLVDSKTMPILGPTPPLLNDQVIEKSRKPHHPDTKFLSQILTVPKMDELSEFDDQEWLFGSKDPSLRKNEVSSASVSEELQVWSKAVNIESTDIVALPYVLPY